MNDSALKLGKNRRKWRESRLKVGEDPVVPAADEEGEEWSETKEEGKQSPTGMWERKKVEHFAKYLATFSFCHIRLS